MIVAMDDHAEFCSEKSCGWGGGRGTQSSVS